MKKRQAKLINWLNDAIPDVVTESIGDPNRVCPMLAGPAMIVGNRLIVRLAQRDLEVNAPKRLLSEVFHACDGTRKIGEILSGIGNPEKRERFGHFLSFLMDSGAMIDANLYTATALGYACDFNSFGYAADDSVSGTICRRFTSGKAAGVAGLGQKVESVASSPLSPFFEKRISTHTFDDGDIRLDQLTALLWSLCGVVRLDHERAGSGIPRRTVASAGGMHLIQAYVVLQKAVGDYGPGVYSIHYPSEKRIALQLISTQLGLLPRAFTKPWYLSFATGVIFLAGDAAAASLRYRNRALQYLFTEAGAALHNGALTAPMLALGYSTLGSYYENIVESLCEIQDKVVLGSAVFGPAPTEAQRALVDCCPKIEFAWSDAASPVYSIPYFLGRAKVKKDNTELPYTWGRGADPWLAYTKAVAEAIEREGYREPKNIVSARMSELDSALDPRRLVRYSERQYRSPEFPYRRFDEAETHCWVDGSELVGGKPVNVLAEMVYPLSSIQSTSTPARSYTQTNSSGCAAGVSLDDALYRAILEVVERDAFMRHWMTQTPGVSVVLKTLPAGLRARVNALEEAGCEVIVQRLESKWARVSLVSAQHAEKHFTCIGASARADLERAIAGALDELEARVYAWLHDHDAEKMTPAAVLSPEHHFQLYGIKTYFRRADRILRPDVETVFKKNQHRHAGSLQGLCDSFSKSGCSPIYVDITPEKCGVEQGRKKLTVVKTFVPSLIPISFGYGREPEGMVPRIHGGSRFPHPFP